MIPQKKRNTSSTQGIFGRSPQARANDRILEERMAKNAAAARINEHVIDGVTYQSELGSILIDINEKVDLTSSENCDKLASLAYELWQDQKKKESHITRFNMKRYITDETGKLCAVTIVYTHGGSLILQRTTGNGYNQLRILDQGTLVHGGQINDLLRMFRKLTTADASTVS